MITATQTIAVSNKAVWTGRILSGLVVLFLALDGAMKLAKPAPVVEALTKFGMSGATATAIGLLLLACTALYAIPRTSILGAVLLTGYLGGAVAAQVVVHNSAFETLFPVIFGVLVWVGLYLKESKLRSLVSQILG